MRLIIGNINTSSPFGILYHPGTIYCKTSFTVYYELNDQSAALQRRKLGNFSDF